MASQIPTVTFNNGVQMPVVGLGTWKSEPGVVAKAVKEAYACGYRAFDCAAIYLNEKEIGQAFQELFDSGVQRSDLFITSKVWNTDHARAHLHAAYEQTCKDLHVDYLDLYLVHWPIAFENIGPLSGPTCMPRDASGEIRFGKVTLQETWQAMEELVEQKKVRAIGVSNYTLINLIDLLTFAKVVPVVNQVEYHAYLNQHELRTECEKRGVKLTAYSPLGSGKLGPLQDDGIAKIAQKHKKTPAQVLIRWLVQLNLSTIPKSVSAQRVKENLDVFDFALDASDMQLIESLNRNLRTCDTREYWNFPAFA